MAKKNRSPHPLIAQAKREIEATISYSGLRDRSENVEPSPSRPLRDPSTRTLWKFPSVARAAERFNERR